mgnify:CR=1 FL=1
MRGWFRFWRSKGAQQEYPDQWISCPREVWIPKSANRPLTLRLPLIGYNTEQVGNQLLQSELQWFWCCWWKEHHPWDHPIKLLAEATLSEFIADAEREEDMFLYFLEGYGFLPGVESPSSHVFIGNQLVRFYEGEHSLLQMVLQRLDDEPEECTYVSVSRDWGQEARVRQLLEWWGVDEQFMDLRVFHREHGVLRDLVLLYRRWLTGRL